VKEKKMDSKLIALSLGGLLALGSFLTKPAMGDEANKRTEVQFSAPVEIPGKVLAPGKYVFELADRHSQHNVVQVFSEDPSGSESLIATVFATPVHASDTPDKPLIHFEERAAGTPMAIRNWFYPGDDTGWGFVYPNGQSQ
jgi:hypothetical protein